jgi:twitching motility protein PilT
MELQTLLQETIDRDASDLHLKSGQPPVFRVHGRLIRSTHAPLPPKEVREIVYSMLSEEQRQHFEGFHELDLAVPFPPKARFRVNVYQQRETVGAALRLIPLRVRTIDELSLPQVLKTVSLRPRGLVLVTGPTGSGKSTTLAAAIEFINSTTAKHIITIEDPMEFSHQDKMSAITQREIGLDSHSFAAALRHVMRQNPDVILVGEMRDLETMALAITAAETGHLVFSTLHTVDATQTVDRIIDAFDPDQQEQIRLQLSVTLEAVFSQQLLPQADGKGRAAAFEILIATSPVRSLVRAGRTYQLPSVIQGGGESGMQTLDQALVDLYRRGLVTFEEALSKSSSPRDFEHLARKV